MSVYFSDNAVLQMRRETMDTGKVIGGGRSSKSSHMISQTTKPLIRNHKDNKISIGIGDALSGKRFSGHSPSAGQVFTKQDGSGVTSVLNAGVAGLTSPTLEWKVSLLDSFNLSISLFNTFIAFLNI